MQELGSMNMVQVKFVTHVQTANAAASQQLFRFIEKLLYCNKLTRDDRGTSSAGSPEQPCTGSASGPNHRAQKQEKGARCICLIATLMIDFSNYGSSNYVDILTLIKLYNIKIDFD